MTGHRVAMAIAACLVLVAGAMTMGRKIAKQRLLDGQERLASGSSEELEANAILRELRALTPQQFHDFGDGDKAYTQRLGGHIEILDRALDRRWVARELLHFCERMGSAESFSVACYVEDGLCQIVHYVESVPGYEADVVESFIRRPTVESARMLGRIRNVNRGKLAERLIVGLFSLAAYHPCTSPWALAEIDI